MNLFVTGTDTSVGKTLVSAIVCLKLGWNYWKPIQSGLEDLTDRQQLERWTEVKAVPETYHLQRPLSPHASAQADGIEIDLDRLVDASRSLKKTVIEGAGGLLVPINRNFMIIDLIQAFKARPLLVARSGLGTINHTLLSIEALRQREIEPMGVVMIGDFNGPNREAIERYGRVRVLGEIPWLPKIDRAALTAAGDLIDLKGVTEWS